MRKHTLLFTSLIILLISSCSNPQKGWITDLDEAAKVSAETNKDVILIFTGSDWNQESMDLSENLFTKKFFATGTKKYVLCNIDIVQDTELLDEAILHKNYDIASNYAVQQFPSVILMTPEMDIYGSFKALSKDATVTTFYEQVESYSASKEKLVSLKTLIEETEGIEKAKNMDLFLDSLSPTQRKSYKPFILEIIELDSDSSADLKPKYLLQLQYMTALDLGEEGDLESAGAGLFSLARSGMLDPARNQEALFMGSYMYAMSETATGNQLVEWLTEAIDADPENPSVEQIRENIEQIKESYAEN